MEIHRLKNLEDEQMLTKWLRTHERIFVVGQEEAFTPEEFVVFQADNFNKQGLDFNFFPVSFVGKRRLWGVLKLSKTDNIELYKWRD